MTDELTDRLRAAHLSRPEGGEPSPQSRIADAVEALDPTDARSLLRGADPAGRLHGTWGGAWFEIADALEEIPTAKERWEAVHSALVAQGIIRDSDDHWPRLRVADELSKAAQNAYWLIEAKEYGEKLDRTMTKIARLTGELRRLSK